MTITIKQAANDLDISESTVKKYLKDFELPVVGSGNKTSILEETLNALKEITKLRANGLSIQEIKELKSQEPTKSILEEIDETAKPKEKDLESKEKVDDISLTSSLEFETNGTGEQKVAEDEVLSEPDEPDLIEEDDTVGRQDESPERFRRRGFNPRYVERQISQDSKRIASLNQRLKNPNLSISDRLFFEEALERRIVLLNGWRHILRWASK